MNRDEALRCRAISQGYLAEGNRPLAIKYAQKAFQLYESEETREWLQQVAKLNLPASEPTRASPSSASSSSAASSSAANDAAAWEEIRRLKRIDQHDYYGILAVQRSASDVEIKKAYRRLALLLHPDKCQAPGADEAFKLVSRAFSILSDASKRGVFDQTGRAEGQPHSHHHAAGWEGEVSPEEIFRAFFGGHAGVFAHQHPFVFQQRHGRGRPFVFMHNFPPAGEQTLWQRLISWFPLVFFVAFVILNLLFSSTGPRTPTTMADIAEHVSLHRTWSHWYPRETANLHVPYWSTANYRDHFANGQDPTQLALFEGIIERHHVHALQQACRRETLQLQERIKRARGEELAALQAQTPASCEALHRLGIQ